MEESRTAQEIARTISDAFAKRKERPSPQEVEAVMRPLGIISSKTERAVEIILLTQKNRGLYLDVGPWVEANIVTSGEGMDRETRIQNLLSDTCTCVLDHLRKAIEHAPGKVDERILALFDHEHFKKPRALTDAST